MQNGLVLLCIFAVTPCAGVWIEILYSSVLFMFSYVTPCAGVWIEISAYMRIIKDNYSHSLCGSVD